MTTLKETIQQEIDTYFSGNKYQYFIFIRTYSRFIEALGRRETWVEVVQRYIDFMKERLNDKLSNEEYDEIQKAILKQEVMPSMRLLWSAGDSVRKNNACAYNCWYTAIDDLKKFSEILFLLCSGGGVGYSVEKEAIGKLPEIKEQVKVDNSNIFIVPDSREGWADALNNGIEYWFNGKEIYFDYSHIRPAGSKLKTFGGTSAGPEPLKKLLDFARDIILGAQGRKLTSLEVHDICTKIGEIVVAGGSRRSAQISLSDLHDEEMKHAKDGKFYELYPNRTMANNSAIYNEKPNQQEFMDEWISLMKSGTGERGIFNRYGINFQIPQRRKDMGYMGMWGGNPCMEIILRSGQACNLTEVVAREDDDLHSLMRKIRIATILGTYQSSLTDFIYLSDEWKNNCEEERLLGVSITGQFDCPAIMNDDGYILISLAHYAQMCNKEYANKFGINESTAITCTKPSGTVSQLVNSASGAHPRYAKYYIRRVRISSYDPLFKMLKDQGIKYYPEVGQDVETANTFVLEFPIKSPDSAITRHDITAIQQLEHWKKVKLNYAEHTVSQTVYIGENEWLQVASWVWDNWDIISGLSFLPKEDENHVYELAPYEEIDENEYSNRVRNYPVIDFSKLVDFEKTDETTGASEAACGPGGCDI